MWPGGFSVATLEGLHGRSRTIESDLAENVKWSYFLGQLCGFAKVHLVYVHAAFRIFTWSKYAAFGVRLSSAV